MEQDERRRIEEAVTRGIATYVASRTAKIPEFVEQHFSFRGALALQRRSVLHDIYKVPVNAVWALPAFAAHGMGYLCEKLGAVQVGARLSKVPSGMTTRYQEEINWVIQTELLELPGSQGSRTATKDALLQYILEEPEVAAVCADYLADIEAHSQSPAFRQALEANLAEYGKTRLAVSELAGNLITLASGYAAFQKATPGLLSASTATATALAQHLAINQFWLGNTLGAWYYGVFPASASVGLIAASTGALMVATGILVTLSTVVLDPLLAITGFYGKRLEQFVHALGDSWSGKTDDPYRIKDQYLVRVLDLLDLLKLAARAVR